MEKIQQDDDLFEVDLGKSEHEEFEFRVSVSWTPGTPAPFDLSPADELFYKGQLLPLHHVNSSTLPHVEGTTTASSSTSSSASCSSYFESCRSSHSVDSECDSSRPSCVEERDRDPNFRRSQRWKDSFFGGLRRSGHEEHLLEYEVEVGGELNKAPHSFSFSGARECVVPRSKSEKAKGGLLNRFLHLKLIKPLYNKFHQHKEQNQQQSHSHESPDKITTSTSSHQVKEKNTSFSSSHENKVRNACFTSSYGNKVKTSSYGNKVKNASFSSSYVNKENDASFSSSDAYIKSSASNGGLRMLKSRNFSGTLKKRSAKFRSSCPSSMRSSPTHSGLLVGGQSPSPSIDKSTMEDLQNAIQGAIAHCKNSQANPLVIASSNGIQECKTQISKKCSAYSSLQKSVYNGPVV